MLHLVLLISSSKTRQSISLSNLEVVFFSQERTIARFLNVVLLRRYVTAIFFFLTARNFQNELRITSSFLCFAEIKKKVLQKRQEEENGS